MSDERIIERFRVLFEEQHALVYRFVYALVGSADAAAELTQETFFRAFRAFGRFEARSAASTWLCGIARNVALNDLRAKRQFARVFAAGEVDAHEPGVPQDRQVLTRELREAIRSGLLALDEDKRVAFTLKVLEGKSYEEIAAITGSAIAKLKTDVHRARQQLRAVLRGYVEES